MILLHQDSRSLFISFSSPASGAFQFKSFNTTVNVYRADTGPSLLILRHSFPRLDHRPLMKFCEPRKNRNSVKLDDRRSN